MEKNGIKIEIGWPSRAGEPISLRVGGETVPLASYEADRLASELQTAADVALGQEREAVAAAGLLERLPAGMERRPGLPSVGVNEPTWKAGGEHLMLQWKDDQGRRCTRFAAIFHDQAGREEWASKALAVVVPILNEADSAAVVLASEYEGKPDV